MKKIRLTIEWSGACSEEDWADVLRKAIEQFDTSGLTRVSEIECVTDFGTTEPLTLAPKRRGRLLQGMPPWPRL